MLIGCDEVPRENLVYELTYFLLDNFFFFSSRRRHTRCALVTGVQTCALPILMMHDHAFSVPKDASGRAEVHGVLSVKEISKEAAEHLAEDGNGVVPPTRELRIDATGVRIEG